MKDKLLDEEEDLLGFSLTSPLEILSITFFHLWIAFFRKLFVIPIAWFLRCLIKIAFTTSVYCLFVLILTTPAFPFSLTYTLQHLILKSNDLRNE